MNWNQPLLTRALPITLIAGAVVLLASWKNQQPRPDTATHASQDTVPRPNRSKITRQPGDKDLDQELRALEQARAALEQQKDIDWEEIQRTVAESLKKIDLDKIQLQTQQALAEIDMAKIQQQVTESLKSIDFDAIQKSVQESMKNNLSKEEMDKVNAELDKARQEVKEELRKKDWQKELAEVKKINTAEIKAEMEKAKVELAKARVDLEKVKAEMAEQKVNFNAEMQKAQQELEKAKSEFQSYQALIYSLEKDGLLSTDNDYTIEYREGKLLINGKEQPAPVADKYKPYFKKDPTTIKKRNGKVDVDN